MKIDITIIKKEQIKRIYTEGSGWVVIDTDITIDYTNGEYCILDTWNFNNMTVLRKSIQNIEWTSNIANEDKMRTKITVDVPDDEIPF